MWNSCCGPSDGRVKGNDVKWFDGTIWSYQQIIIIYVQDEFQERPAIGNAISSIANYQATIQQVRKRMIITLCCCLSSSFTYVNILLLLLLFWLIQLNPPNKPYWPQAPDDPNAKPQVKANLGTLMGVFLPCIQNIFGVILFIRWFRVFLLFLLMLLLLLLMTWPPPCQDDLDSGHLWCRRRFPLCLGLLSHGENTNIFDHTLGAQTWQN